MINERVKAQDYFIREIIDYSRNARLEPDLKDVFIKAFTEEVIQSLFFIEGAEKIKFTIAANADLAVRSDPSRLKSIINNLLSNAIKYHDTTKPNQFINVACQLFDRHWVLTVEDNGIGIMADRHDKVFDMFYRGTELSDGSGLGLFIVKETVERLGGAIGFESQYGIGSMFKVTFPIG
jgi:signal transduction histidine kinase